MKDLDEILQRAYSARSEKDLLDLYSSWSESFDDDVVARLGYRGHRICVQGLLRHFDDRNAAILDVGCGTGLVGQTLSAEGFEHIDGLDLSPEMLQKAGEKGVYGKLIQADLNRPLKIPDDTYGAVVCAGTFTYGHVRGTAFAELVRITRPGGVVCFTIREGAYDEYDYRKDMIGLQEKGLWVEEELRDEKMFESGVTGKVGVFTVNP